MNQWLESLNMCFVLSLSNIIDVNFQYTLGLHILLVNPIRGATAIGI